MATVTGMTAAEMLAIKNASIVNGAVVGDNLILTKQSGATVNAGNVRGPAGSNGISTFSPKLYKAFSAWTTPIPTGVTTAVTGWSHTAATSTPGVASMVTIAANGDFTINEAGLYNLTFTATFPSNTVGRRVAIVHKNGVEQRRQNAAAASDCTIEVVEPQILVVGDIISFRVYQNSGGSLTPGNFPDQHATLMRLS